MCETIMMTFKLP